MKNKVFLILICINLLIPFNIFAYSAKDGSNINEKDMPREFYFSSLFEFYPVIKDLLYTSNGNLKYKMPADSDYYAKGLDEGEYHFEDIRTWSDGENTKYLSVILRSETEGLKNIVVGFKNSVPKVLVDFQDDNYINHFRSSSEIHIYKGNRGYVTKITRTNSWPAGDDNFENPIDTMDFYFVDDGNGNISRPNVASYGEELTSDDELYSSVLDFQSSGKYCKDIQRDINSLNYLRKSYNKESYDRFLQDISEEELKEFKDSLLPIFSGYESLDRGLINSNLIVSVADKLFANIDIAGSGAVASEPLKKYGNSEVAFSENSSNYTFDRESFKKYLKTRYNINAEDKTYSNKINDINLICNLSGEKGVFYIDNNIINCLDYIIMGSLSSYYNYAIIKVMNINQKGVFGSDSIGTDGNTLNILVEKKNIDGNARLIPILASKEEINISQVEKILGRTLKPTYLKNLRYEDVVFNDESKIFEIISQELKKNKFNEKNKLEGEDRTIVKNIATYLMRKPTEIDASSKKLVLNEKFFDNISNKDKLPKDFKEFIEKNKIEVKSVSPDYLLIDMEKNKNKIEILIDGVKNNIRTPNRIYFKFKDKIIFIDTRELVGLKNYYLFISNDEKTSKFNLFIGDKNGAKKEIPFNIRVISNNKIDKSTAVSLDNKKILSTISESGEFNATKGISKSFDEYILEILKSHKNKELTKEDFANILSKTLMAKNINYNLDIKDVEKDSPSYKNIAYLCNMGIMTLDNNKFNPKKVVTTEEVYVILARVVKKYNFGVLNKSLGELLNKDGYEEVSYWAKEDLSYAINYKILNIENSFAPKDKISSKNLEIALKNFYNAFYSQDPKTYREISDKDLGKISNEDYKNLKEIRKVVNPNYSEKMSFIIIIIFLILIALAIYKRNKLKNLIINSKIIRDYIIKK